MMKMVADLNGKYLAAIDTGRREKNPPSRAALVITA
jgi:hypothetical protein